MIEETVIIAAKAKHAPCPYCGNAKTYHGVISVTGSTFAQAYVGCMAREKCGARIIAHAPPFRGYSRRKMQAQWVTGAWKVLWRRWDRLARAGAPVTSKKRGEA